MLESVRVGARVCACRMYGFVCVRARARVCVRVCARARICVFVWVRVT